jgi:hypothetical protein
MQRMAVWAALAAIGVLWLCGVAGAQEQSVGTPDLQSIPVKAGDPTWKPTDEQLSKWVEDGILAAGLEMYLYDLPATLKWMWTSENGTDLPGDRKLRFVVMMTPQLAGLTAGYAASWVEETWARIQEDQRPVVEELVGRLRPAFDGRQVYFAVGILGQVFNNASAAVYYDGEWRDADLSPFGRLSDYVEGEVAPGALSARWAAGYLIGQSLDDPAFAPSDDLQVYVGVWYSRPERRPSEALVSQLETPSDLGNNTVRFVVGTADGYAYTDFQLGQ